MDALLEMLTGYAFMRNALLAAFLASAACGIVGTLVLANRLTFLAGGASHTAYGGIGIAMYFGLPMLPCTLLFTLLASLGMGAYILHEEQKKGHASLGQDAAIGVLWAGGMALGIILVSLTPGYAGDFMGFLFGSILAVPTEDLAAMAVFDAALLLLLAVCRQGVWAVSLDRDFARARGLPVRALYLLLIGITAVAVVMLIRIVGLILVLALLTIPPLMARTLCRSLFAAMASAALLAFLFCLLGLLLAVQADLPAGAAIIAVASAVFFLTEGYRRINVSLRRHFLDHTAKSASSSSSE